MRPEPSATAHGIRVGAGIFAGSALLATLDACAIALTVPLPPGGLPLRVAHHAFDAAETLGVGALAAAGIGAFVRFARLPGWATVCVTSAAAIAIAYRVIGWRLARFALYALDGRFERGIFVGYFVLIGVCLPALLHVTSHFSHRPRLRFLPVSLAVCVIAADELCLPDDYADMHGIVALGAAIVGGAALAPGAEHAARALWRARSGRVALAATGLLALLGICWPPSNEARFELFRQHCAVAPWALATTLWRAPRLHTPTPLPPSPWLQDRSSAPLVPPAAPPLLPPDAVVVLVTIDALRAGAVSDPANDALLPTFTRLKRDGVVFAHASAAGSETAVSLSALFSGRYFSEQLWTDHGVGSRRALFPADDLSPRFPELLSARGVATANYASLDFLTGEFGVLRGFREEGFAVRGWRHTRASGLIAPLARRLMRPESGPLFFYVHLVDPHRPYDGGRQDGTDYERYLSEVAVADAALGQILEQLTLGFGARWALFVTADHGEAFGEHQSSDHAKTLYEELLHVPLLARSPLFPPRVIDERVGLVDLGPTILDLFGVASPATFDGQSLAPLLAGGAMSLTRPLLAEGRLRRAITQSDGLKVIDDPRRKVVEAYDLGADPGETRNLFDVEPARADSALAVLRAFFAVHARRDEGYEIPYRP